MNHDVTIFRSYPFKKGEKIRIKGSGRSGDWEVIDCSKSKVTLRCPISKKEYQWSRFCYHVEEKNMKWPDD
jgi:hypothetical protein